MLRTKFINENNLDIPTPENLRGTTGIQLSVVQRKQNTIREMSDSLCLLCLSWPENNTSGRAGRFQTAEVASRYNGRLIREPRRHSRSYLQYRFLTTKNPSRINIVRCVMFPAFRLVPAQRAIRSDSLAHRARKPGLLIDKGPTGRPFAVTCHHSGSNCRPVGP